MGLRITVDCVLLFNGAHVGEITLVRLWCGFELIDHLTLDQFEQHYGFRAANDLLRR